MSEPPAAEHAAPAAAEVEDAAPFEEEVALLGEEEGEAREVHLLLVDLHLREVGVHGEVGGEVRRDRVLHVAADLLPNSSFTGGHAHAVAASRAPRRTA